MTVGDTREIPKNPGEWTYEDAERAALIFAPHERVSSIIKFYEGDHWQDGNGWIGPWPAEKAAPGSALAIGEIKRAFVSHNAIKETVGRQRSALLSRAIQVTVTKLQNALKDTQAGQAGDAEAELLQSTLRAWIEREDTATAIEQAVTNSILADRSSLRFYLPPAALSGSTLRQHDLSAAHKALYLDAVPVGKAGIYVERTERTRIGLYIDPDIGYAEIAYRMRGDTDVTIRQLYANQEASKHHQVRLGWLPIYEILQGDTFVTDQMVSQQKALNLAESLFPRNAVTAGFLERVVTNSKIEGKTITDEDGNERFVAYPIQWGAGVTNFFTGLKTKGQNGQDSYTTPEINYHDPVPPDTFTQTSRHHYERILGEANQLHYLIAGDATASGASRVTAMSAHVISVLRAKAIVDRALTWVVQEATAYFELLTGQPGRWTDRYKIQAEAVAEFGPISSEMIASSIAASKAKLLSRQTAMSWIGVTDPKAEEAQIGTEEASPLALQAQMALQLEQIGALLTSTEKGGDQNVTE